MGIQPIDIIKYTATSMATHSDYVAIEEPLEISIAYLKNGDYVFKNIAVTMRTPGDDEALAIGFLVTEQIINVDHTIEKISTKGENKICVFIKNELILDPLKVDRNFYTTSSCGVCGKAAIASVMQYNLPPIFPKQISIAIEKIYGLKEAINNHQSAFETTGGIHAAALFSLNSQLLNIFEDVGRHNALDKLIGHQFLNQLNYLPQSILLLSGRASFELIQKAAIAQIPIVCALGAPSSLAVSLAIEADITLVGFLKNNSANIYCGAERIKL
jgi:FdhD protein